MGDKEFSIEYENRVARVMRIFGLEPSKRIGIAIFGLTAAEIRIRSIVYQNMINEIIDRERKLNDAGN